MRAYKFLTADGRAVFSGFGWPLPSGAPGEWVEARVELCRSGVHACRPGDLSYWLAPALYEIELDGDVAEAGMKVVAARGRLIRRIDAWNDAMREEYSQMCIARAGELAASAPELVGPWAPPSAASAAGPALMGYIAARMAEAISGVEAYVDERARQSAWLAERLDLA
ncbi:MAG TPA: hypothetical protein VHH57_04935 [Gaiella sp.]|nr:hypothetical protein [Gaiella sp.]